MKKKTEIKEPIVIHTTSLSKEKMDAIGVLSKTVYELAKALNSASENITIQNCEISNCGVGLEIKPAPRNSVKHGEY